MLCLTLLQKSTTAAITINNNNNNNNLKLLTYVFDVITRKRWKVPGFIEELVKNSEW